MSKSVDIERLTIDDTDRLRTLRLRALRDAPEAFGSTAEETAARPPASWVQQLADLPTYVAVVDGVDVGMVRRAPHAERPDTAYLISMWVAPTARGLGAGDALIDALVADARGDGYVRIVLDVGDANGPAVALYARKGFVPTGATSALPPPRDHVREHERGLEL